MEIFAGGGPVHILIGGMTTADVASIQARDTGFDTTDFLAWAQRVHFAVAQAFSTGEPEGLRRYVGANLYPRLAAQVAQAKQPGQPAVHDTGTDDHPSISGAHTDASLDTIVVRLTSSIGSSDGTPQPVNWTFQRSSSASTPPGGLAAAAAPKCAGCGAPLRLDAAGDCVYCKAPAAAGPTDWVLVQMETAAPDFVMPETTAVTTATGCMGRIWIIGLVIGILGVVAAIVIPIVATTHHTVFRSVIPPIPRTGGGSKTLATRLTLSGAISLNPSDLNTNEVIVNGAANGACPAANQPIRNVVLNVTFDSGAKIQGSFVLPSSAAANTTVDLGNGGVAALHYTGATRATNDDQTWVMPAGKAGAVTVSTDPTGAGTLKWQELPAGQPDHNYSAASSGLLTWSCH